MLITIPVLVAEQKQENSGASLQIVRSLFFGGAQEQAESLQRALNKLAGALRQRIETLGKEARHDEIAGMCFAPAVSGKMLQFKLNFGAQNFDCQYFFATFSGFGKRLAFAANLPEVWFEIERGEDLQQRAETVLDDYFKRLEQREGRGTQDPTRFNSPHKTWLTTVEFDVSLQQKYEPKADNFFALLGAADKMNGAEELRKTGRNLDLLFPNELERAIGREKELEQLTDFLNQPDKRPVLLVGKRLTGKTALVHEFVFQTISKRQNLRQPEQNTWLLQPQRLIAGMMFVGQWEERLLAILKEAKEKKHLLYFDDLLGLFGAGQSAGSDLSMAAVLKPFVERREIRFLAEITLEALRILQEKDRSFADLFQVIRLDETNDDETLKITLSIRRELEQKYGCSFLLDALPTALDLTRRYQRESQFPGKIAVFLKQLAVKFGGKEIRRADVLREFTAKSGMSVQFLDDNAKLDRAEIVKEISSSVIGQPNAASAAADAISIAKARLNDTARPLASFLFLGATGTGKTEAAKQIAAYLYGDDNAEKLLRFDMNEFVSGFDAARLVGTFDQPEGLLTGAIRRQPFAIVLFDEIEKAHPDVFNLLLQVLGDARLTDALGRTVDFSNAIIILTSNLGAREANTKPGFRQTDESEAGVFVRAAEQFFKPGFFNRFDRVVPFERLSRTDVEFIAKKQLQKIFARNGFLGRNCKLNVEPAALNLIVERGYHPQLGARALKRALENLLIQPIAQRLAALAPDAPVTVRVSAQDGFIKTEVEELKLTEIARSVWLFKDYSNINAELDKIADALDRIEDSFESLKPAGEISPGDREQAVYFLVREHVKRIERMITRAERWFEREDAEVQSPKSKVQSLNPARRPQRNLIALRDSEIIFAKLLGASNLALRLKELAAENPIFGAQIEDYVQDIWRETALLEALANDSKTKDQEGVLQIVVSDANGETLARKLLELYKELFAAELGLKISIDESQLKIRLHAAHALALANAETGTHLFVTEQHGFVTLMVRAFNNSEKETSAETAVVRVYDGRGRDLRFALDFRSGLMTKDVLTVRELRAFLLSGLPLPPELN